MPPKLNSKAQAGRARKEETAAQKAAAAADAAKEAELAKEWSQGANEKGRARVDDAAARADEAARKRQEKEALLAQEEAALGSGGKGAKVPTLSKNNNSNKKKGGKANDLFLLEQALVSDAEKKRRAKKQAEIEKKQKEEQAAKERAEAKEQEALRIDPLLLNTDLMLEGAVGREGNLLAMETAMTAGLDGALQSLSISVPGSEVKSQKALYMAFEEKTLPIVKQEYPGLRLSQYKEKIFALWKKSPDNPLNQVPP
ncbi:hypothetical protein MHU86_16069 [Fragilaria crotonensis]|nr:hypothetical protein MHU86_16069 [Fragilaria crotonensis]